MSRLSVFIIIALFSCKDPTHKTSRPVTDTASIVLTQESKTIPCEELLQKLVKSSNTAALKIFGDTAVQVRLSNTLPEKITIELYVVDVSDRSSIERRVENTIGWLEFHKKDNRLLDITDDPENPLTLTYDTTLVRQYDLFSLCRTNVTTAGRSAGYEEADFMLADAIRFNGKLKRFFTLEEFKQVFGNPDSVKLLKDEAPCVTVFDTESPDDKYLFKNGSRFETSGDSVAVDEFWFLNGNYIHYKGTRIDAETKMTKIKDLFPGAEIGKLNVFQEGVLWVMELKENPDHNSEGHIKLFFKNGKVYFIHWWLPC
ncbi:hypothetical protein [Sphingobacterium suaedae]|uniref:Lipoprotein n=1 Tax=Sphingobacterium suaedae TaxID=1686402 RepID=A0ABW5KEI3_9SPHI